MATVADQAGRSSKTEVTRWVSGGNRRPERNVVQEEVTLIPDQQEYAPGDQAEILVEAPFSSAQGLLTDQPQRVSFPPSHSPSTTPAPCLSIPIQDEYIPNVHIQVDLVGATGRTADNGDPLPDAPDRPAFAVGRLNLAGAAAEPDADRHRDGRPTQPPSPAPTTRVDVTVTDAAGHPVAGAELAVVVVDEAVLALSNLPAARPAGHLLPTDRFPGLQPVPAQQRSS